MLVDAARVDIDAQLPAVLHAFAVERQHEVAGLQPGARGRAAGRDIREDDAGIDRREAERLGQQRRDRLRVHADVAATHAAGLADLREDVADDVARRGEADTLVAAGLRVDQRADADQPALGIDQRAAAVARIDRARRSGRRSSDPPASAGAPRRSPRRASPRTRGRAGCRTPARSAPACSASESPNASTGRPLRLDLDHRDVGLVIDGHDLRADDAAAPCAAPTARPRRRSRPAAAPPRSASRRSTTCALVTM